VLGRRLEVPGCQHEQCKRSTARLAARPARQRWRRAAGVASLWAPGGPAPGQTRASCTGSPVIASARIRRLPSLCKRRRRLSADWIGTGLERTFLASRRATRTWRLTGSRRSSATERPRARDRSPKTEASPRASSQLRPQVFDVKCTISSWNQRTFASGAINRPQGRSSVRRCVFGRARASAYEASAAATSSPFDASDRKWRAAVWEA